MDQPLLMVCVWMSSTCLRWLCITGTWSTAATRWRAPRRKSICGFVRTSFTAGRTAAATGSTTDSLHTLCVRRPVWCRYKTDHIIPYICLALVARSHTGEDVSSLSCCFFFFHRMYFFIWGEIIFFTPQTCTKWVITWSATRQCLHSL